mgnify:CR=1 FL=1
MSLAVLASRALVGLLAPEVTVEVHLANGLPAFTLVGLPDVEVREARDRAEFEQFMSDRRDASVRSDDAARDQN